MKNQEHKWDSTATVGLATLMVLIAALVAAVVGLSRPEEKEKVTSDIPSAAVNVELPGDKLAAVEELLTPLLRGDVAAFSDQQTLNVGQVMASLLFHLAQGENAYEQTEEGVLLIPAGDGDALFEALFGVVPPRESLMMNGMAGYDPESGCYRVQMVSNVDRYRTDAQVKITSTQTLDDTVYVHAEMLVSVTPEPTVPPETPVPTVTVAPTDIPVEETDEESDTTTGEPEPSEDTEVSEEPEVTLTPEPTEEPTPDVTPEPTYEVIRRVVFTLLYENDR